MLARILFAQYGHEMMACIVSHPNNTLAEANGKESVQYLHHENKRIKYSASGFVWYKPVRAGLNFFRNKLILGQIPDALCHTMHWFFSVIILSVAWKPYIVSFLWRISAELNVDRQWFINRIVNSTQLGNRHQTLHHVRIIKKCQCIHRSVASRNDSRSKVELHRCLSGVQYHSWKWFFVN